MRKLHHPNTGGIAMYVLLAVIILGAFFMVGGAQKIFISPPTDLGNVEVDPASTTNNTSKDSLQLQTLKFKSCNGTAAVDLLIDTSGSMATAGKLQNLQGALGSFASNFNSSTVVGLRRFSSDENPRNPPCPLHNATSRLVPIDFYSSNKAPFISAVQNTCANGGTNTATAFAAELDDLKSKVTDPKFKDYTFNLIFLSDGIPESQASDITGACTGREPYPVCATDQAGNCRCFDTAQDPTTNPQIAQQIRDLKSINGKNVNIYSILVFDPVTDGPFKDKVATMMKNIASSPPSTYYYNTSDPAQIKNIYSQISEKICKSNEPTTP